jgi:hypothetical protein
VGSQGGSAGLPPLRITFYVAALFLAIGSFTFRRTQLRWFKLQAVAGIRGREGLVKYLANITLASVAMAELIGLLGLVLSFLGGDRRDVLTFGLVAMIVALASYPRRIAWERTTNYLTSGEAEPDGPEETAGAQPGAAVGSGPSASK